MFLSVLLIIYITNRNDDPYYRLAWTIIILVIPPIGAVCYLIFGGKKVPKKLRERISDTYSKDAFYRMNHLVSWKNPLSNAAVGTSCEVFNGEFTLPNL